MANIVTYTRTLLKPYYNYIIGFLLLVFFLLVAKFTYDMYFDKLKKKKKYDNVANAKNTKDICAVYFFFADWCPHCTKAKPEWEAFSNVYHNKVINGYIIKCFNVDCTSDNGSEVIQVVNGEEMTYISPTPIRVDELVRKYGVDSYPTIKMAKGDIVVDFDSKVSQASLAEFVKSV
jgi:thiol-disulfide isomerase/thioredoxin